MPMEETSHFGTRAIIRSMPFANGSDCGEAIEATEVRVPLNRVS